MGFRRSSIRWCCNLGGSDPGALAEAAVVGADWGYDEINLNVGCPSDRVQEGRFGACLMAEPELVAKCVAAMQDAVQVPVTVKCRIGIDDQDGEADFARFIEIVAGAGCRLFIVHARKAWLQGLSPKENREVPPLNYDRVWRLKEARPDLTVVINGGIGTLEAAHEHLQYVDGVMLGRAAYQTPWLMSRVDQELFGVGDAALTREEVLARLADYADAHVVQGGRINNIARHILGLYHGEPGGRLFRRHISEHGPRSESGGELLREAGAIVREAAARTRMRETVV